jgi:hypothetical protein
MRKIIVAIFMFAYSVTLFGCSGTLPAASYTPQNFVRVEGNIDIGAFSYQPYLDGAVKSNQIQNTAIGSVYMGMDVAEYVRRGTALELEKSGVVLNESNPYALIGRVLQLKADDLGYSIHWYYSINYQIIDKQTKSVLFDKTFEPEMKKTGKFGLAADYAMIVAERILAGYDLFIRDADARNLLIKK